MHPISTISDDAYLICIDGWWSKEKLAIKAPRPKTAVDALEDKYRGVDPLAIIDDLERILGNRAQGLPGPSQIQQTPAIYPIPIISPYCLKRP
jgi:hypothetical protein